MSMNCYGFQGNYGCQAPVNRPNKCTMAFILVLFILLVIICSVCVNDGGGEDYFFCDSCACN